MPCGARLEVVQVAVQREDDVHVADHVDVDVRVLPVLAPERLDEIIREELVTRGWTREPDGTLTKHLEDAIATLPAGTSTVRISLADERNVAVQTKVTERITEGDEAARAAVQTRADAEGERRLEAAKEAARKELVRETADKLLRIYGELRGEISDAVNATTKRALEIRANELGAVEAVREGRAADGSYELAITVRT